MQSELKKRFFLTMVTAISASFCIGSSEAPVYASLRYLPPQLDPIALTFPEIASVRDVPACNPMYQQLVTLTAEQERLFEKLLNLRQFQSELLYSGLAERDAETFAEYLTTINAEIRSTQSASDVLDTSLEALRSGTTAELCLLLNRLRELPRIVAFQPSTPTDDGQLTMLALLKEIQPLLKVELTEIQFALLTTFLGEWRATVKILQEVVTNRSDDES